MAAVHDINTTLTRVDEVVASRHRLQHSSDSLLAYRNICAIKKIGNTKFSVYLVYSQVTKEYYAMKVFPYRGESPHNYFQNEMRFTSLKHENVVNFVHCEKKRDTFHHNKVSKVSYILMEYASNGDLFDFITNYGNRMDEKLIRTYFRQLIEGIEYLHNNGIIHLDLKLENLLLDSNFNLKITDFDLSYQNGDEKVLGVGSRYSRAPELFRSVMPAFNLKVTSAVDIYSAAIILFIMKSGGNYPHSEDETIDGVKFIDLLYRDNNRFWDRHCEIERREGLFYDESFRRLFNDMVRENPNDRLTIRQIKQSEWYNGPVYSPVELYNKMKELRSF